MALQKPGWLESFLGLFNWTILTWHVNPGDAIEVAIDFVIAWINYAIDVAQGAWDWLASVVDWVLELWGMIWAGIGEQVSVIWATITTWWDDLLDWWSATWQGIQDWIGTIVDWVNDSFSVVTGALNNLIVSWNNFITGTLPGLASRLDIKAAFDSFMLLWRGLFNFWEEFKSEIALFIKDPYQYIYDRVDKFVERFW